MTYATTLLQLTMVYRIEVSFTNYDKFIFIRFILRNTLGSEGLVLYLE